MLSKFFVKTFSGRKLDVCGLQSDVFGDISMVTDPKIVLISIFCDRLKIIRVNSLYFLMIFNFPNFA